ncbi:helix-turn-helix domain-containing protein [Marinifilum caeruleilacunae]|nr:helix-turn-helix domain-containing protein [Marinifilum caeruleilacunae]
MSNEKIPIERNKFNLQTENFPQLPFIVISRKDLEKSLESFASDMLANIPTSHDVSKRILVLKEAAEYIQMPVPTFREYLARNEIKGAKIGKSWRFFPEDLDEFVKKYLRKTNDEIDKEIDDVLSK